MPLINTNPNPTSTLGSLSEGYRNFAAMMSANRNTQNDAASARLNDAKTIAQEFKNKTRQQGFDRTMAMMPQQGTQVNTDANGVMTAGDTPWTPDQQMQRQDIGNLAQMYAEGATNNSPWGTNSAGQMESSLSGDIRGLTSDQEAAQSLSGMAGLEAKNLAEGQTTAMQNLSARGLIRGTPEYQTAMEVDMTNGTPQYDADGKLVGVIGGSGGQWGRKAQGTVETNILSKGQTSRELVNLNKLIDRDLFSTLQKSKNLAGNWLSKNMGIPLNKEERDYNKRKQSLFVPVQQLFNSYRKEITGAAAAIQELDRLMKDFPNSTDSYEDFVDKLEALKGTYERNYEYWREMKSKGFQDYEMNATVGKDNQPTIEAPAGWVSKEDGPPPPPKGFILD